MMFSCCSPILSSSHSKILVPVCITFIVLFSYFDYVIIMLFSDAFDRVDIIGLVSCFHITGVILVVQYMCFESKCCRNLF